MSRRRTGAGAARGVHTPRDILNPTLALAALAAISGTVPRGASRIMVAPAETLAVDVQGAGPPVVIIPGMLGSAFGFRKVSAGLASQGYETIVVTPLGVGASSRPPHADYSLEQQSRRVEAVLDSLHIRNAVLLCHSIGASIGLRLAARRPDQVAGLISINGGPVEQAGTPGIRFALRLAPLLGIFGGRSLIRHRVAHGLKHASGNAAWVTPAVVTAYTAPFAGNLHATLTALRRMVDARPRTLLVPQLPSIRAPVVLMLGTDRGEHGIDDAQIATLAHGLPHFSEDTVPDAGLYIQEEQPGAVVAAVLKLERSLRVAKAG